MYTPVAINAADIGYRVLIYNTAGQLVDLPNDITQGSFTDVINGGSAEGSFTVPRRFVDLGWINYEYRVQFFILDCPDPWYDGRIIDFDQQQLDNYNEEQIVVSTEGWQTRLSYGIVSEVFTPGGYLSPGVTIADAYADGYLTHLLSTYMDSSVSAHTLFIQTCMCC